MLEVDGNSELSSLKNRIDANKLTVIPTKSKFIVVNFKYVDQTACKTCPNDFQFSLAKKLDPVATLPLFLCSPEKKTQIWGLLLAFNVIIHPRYENIISRTCNH